MASLPASAAEFDTGSLAGLALQVLSIPNPQKVQGDGRPGEA
eukprot:CAMPEP_0115373930 /NCGR_PEP_ID=MMETSP0271-20121206/1690_1 /TAXON_ID=71861 /ORGANISM="Scrippsiella trochoidea, Strain CCMP3099" /LENGTH=41 /DNA_ID= /DNA_START= /DNA_END= /DNA_ORIENTATION=